MRKPLLSLCVLALFVASARADLLIRSHSAPRHDRQYVGLDKAFVGDPYDFSGVGFTGTFWATLVSDRYFLSADHFNPENGDTVIFHENNDPLGATHSYTVVGGTRIGTTDLWVGQLDAAVDSSIARYSILDLPTEGDYVGLELFNYGRTHRVGRNILDDLDISSDGISTGVTMAYDYDDSDTPSVGGDETYLEGGDSGGPSFAVRNGMLTLLGIHWARDTSPMVSYDTFVPAYISEVNDVLEGHGETLTVVPEPSTAVLLASSVVSLALRRRRLAARAI